MIQSDQLEKQPFLLVGASSDLNSERNGSKIHGTLEGCRLPSINAHSPCITHKVASTANEGQPFLSASVLSQLCGLALHGLLKEEALQSFFRLSFRNRQVGHMKQGW